MDPVRGTCVPQARRARHGRDRRRHRPPAQLSPAGRLPLIHEASTIGILFSLFVVTVAALNLIIDFDFIEGDVEAGAPKVAEWYAAFALMVTLVWLYLEILRLLSKLRRR